MKTVLSENTHRLLKRADLWIGVGLMILIWAARYRYIGGYGLYEDDYTIVPQAIRMTMGDLLSFVGNYIIHLYGHARPLSNSFIYLFSWLGWKLGGLQGIYLFGYGIFALNAVLFYTLLKRVGGRVFALVGAVAYCLFCVDTTQIFLTHSLGLHPSLTLLLLAFHNYLSGRKALAYGLSAIILFSYESPFPVFFAAPLFITAWDRQWFKELVRHVALLGVMLLAVVLLRRWLGEDRVADLSATTAIGIPLSHMLQGPLICMKQWMRAAYQVARVADSGKWAWLAIAGASLTALLAWARPLEVTRRPPWAAWSGILRPWGQRILAGMAMLVLAYPLTFTVSVQALDGRDTRVHFAAVIGASWLVACVGALLLQATHVYLHRLAGAAVLGVLFALWLGFGFGIQDAYRQSWQIQRQFWAQLLPLVPDAGDGDVIVVEPGVVRSTTQIGALTWNTPRVLALIYDFPTQWQNPPRVYRLEPNWAASLGAEEDRLQLNAQTSFIPESMFLTVGSQNVIFIEVQDGLLVRHAAPLEMNGRQYLLKQLSTDTQNFARTPLYDLLLAP